MFFTTDEIYKKPCVENLLPNISAVYNTTMTNITQLNSTMIQNDVTKSCMIKYTTASAEYWE